MKTRRVKRTALAVVLVGVWLPGMAMASVASPGPIAHYTFDNTLLDATGNGYDGAAAGSIAYDASGIHAQALSLDGSSHVGLGDNFDTLAAMSSSLWVKTDGDGIGNLYPKIFAKHADGGGTSNKSFLIQSLAANHSTYPSQFNARVYGSSGFYDVTGGPTIQPDAWYHVVVTYDLGGMKLYVNGDLVDTTSQQLDVSDLPIAGNVVMNDTAIETRVGSNDNGTKHQGAIDDLQIYDRVLSSNEVEMIYLSGIPEPASLVVLSLGGITILRRCAVGHR